MFENVITMTITFKKSMGQAKIMHLMLFFVYSLWAMKGRELGGGAAPMFKVEGSSQSTWGPHGIGCVQVSLRELRLDDLMMLTTHLTIQKKKKGVDSLPICCFFKSVVLQKGETPMS